MVFREVLNRKLEVLVKDFKKISMNLKKFSGCFGSIYGIDILEDNAQIARDSFTINL